MSPRLVILSSLLAALGPGTAIAFDADPDPTFGTAGKVTINFDVAAPLSDEGVAVFEGLDNGGTWVIGSATGGTVANRRLLAITRLNAAGGVIFKRSIPVDLFSIVAAAPAPGGGAVVFADGPGTTGADNVVLKLTAAGNLDTSFSGDGIERLGLTTGQTLDGVVEQDGTVDVLYRNATGIGVGRRQLTRLSPTGVPQSTRVFDTVDTASTGEVELQRDGKVLLVLGQEAAPSCALRIFRYLPASQGIPLGLDPVFGSAPTVLSASACSVFPLDMRVDPIGRIVVLVSNLTNDILVRYLPSGALDTTLGTAGLASISTPALSFRALGIQSNGRIIVGGQFDSGGIRQFAVCRFTNLGAADAGWNLGAYCTIFRFNGTGGSDSVFNQVTDIAIVGGNRVLAAGTMQWSAPSDEDFAVAKILGSQEVFQGSFE